jgi:hypothetical protein
MFVQLEHQQSSSYPINARMERERFEIVALQHACLCGLNSNSQAPLSMPKRNRDILKSSCHSMHVTMHHGWANATEAVLNAAPAMYEYGLREWGMPRSRNDRREGYVHANALAGPLNKIDWLLQQTYKRKHNGTDICGCFDNLRMPSLSGTNRASNWHPSFPANAWRAPQPTGGPPVNTTGSFAATTSAMMSSCSRPQSHICRRSGRIAAGSIAVGGSGAVPVYPCRRRTLPSWWLSVELEQGCT